MKAESTALRRVSLAATLALTSHAEYAAGVAAGLPLWHPWGDGGSAGFAIGLPWLLPVAIDCYVVDALERRNGMDRWAALGILAISVVGGSAYVAADANEAVKAAGVGVVLVLVLARLYAKAKPSKADLAAESTAKAERRAEEQHQADTERTREHAASRLRIEEAEQLARIEASKVHAAAQADGLRIEAEAEAETLRIQAENDAEVARSQAAAETAHAEAERIRAASEAEIARVREQSAAELARIQAEAAAVRPRTASGRRPRTVVKQQSGGAPDKDDAARWVASAMREHTGDEPYVFEWRKWSEKHGGGRTFWFTAKQAAEQGPHLAKAAG